MDNTCNYSTEWQPYIGDYDKFEYDIMLMDGAVIESCYPNARKFNSFAPETNGRGSDNGAWSENIVDKIRFSKTQRLGINPDSFYDNHRGIAIIGPQGHTGKSTLIASRVNQSLADKGMNDVIVVDGNNLAEIRQHLEKRHDAANILMQEMKIPYHAPIELPEIKIVELTNFNQTNKPKKPNKGIKLGSYKFTSKK